MKFRQIGTIVGGQDGAVFGGFLFRFNHKGECSVYDLDKIDTANENNEALDKFSSFILDKADILVPHSNSVVFGKEYYSDGDEFPLLYSNIYNNYASAENPLKGVCCVYRLQREGNKFTTTLVQLIEIGFAEKEELWCSKGNTDIRPYGNFVIDKINGLYYAFTMIDEEKLTRYFSFSLPRLCDGEYDSSFNVKKVILTPDDIIESFDCEYHRFVQGAAFYNGKIYSLEGFTDNIENAPAMRIIDTKKHCQEEYIALGDFGLSVEPELIDFCNDVCYYADNHGNLYIIEY